MITIRPFRAVKPVDSMVKAVAALPYDVYSREEARAVVKDNPNSFLAIDRPETQFAGDQDMYAPEVYEKADQMIRDWINRGIFVRDEEAHYYIWEMTMDGRTQTGLVCVSSVDDYLNHTVKKHENTRREKEADRTKHIDVTSMQTGPIFLAYKDRKSIRALIESIKSDKTWVSFVTEDGVRHRIWSMKEPQFLQQITDAFGELDATYIADGHHRAASAVAASLKRRDAHPDFHGDEEFNYFLSVLFPDTDLKILDYNRVLKTLNGYSEDEILSMLKCAFKVTCVSEKGNPYRPKKKGEMGFYLGGRWYRLEVLPEKVKDDPVGALDVAYLQREALFPVWNISDPRTDSRIDFVGGIRGLEELERRCSLDCAAAFAMYPTLITELFSVADQGLLMPPKSTWFEPKLRSGLFLHEIER